MRNVRLEDVDDRPHDVVPIGTDYPPGHLLAWHSHRRAQLLYAARGVMVVETECATWTVPTQHAVLLPAAMAHQVRMHDVSTLSLYVEPAAAPWWPCRCTVVTVTPLLREVMRVAVDLPTGDGVYDAALLGLALHETSRLPPVQMSLPLPPASPLRDLCLRYLAAPDAGVSNGEWAALVHLSERSLDRAFRRATGTSPAAWRNRARIHAAVAMIASMPVSQVATALGYSSAAAFTTAFTRSLGHPPTKHAQR